MSDSNKAARRDIEFMQRALALARKNVGAVWPNPSVGCVIVQNETVVAEAVTEIGGRPHAEPQALEKAGDRAEGATVYVSLEPCSHWGQTPPCVDALIAARVERVVIAVQDQDARVSGRGIDKLLETGISVETGVCEREALSLNAGFFHRCRTGMPLLTFFEPNLKTVRGYVDTFSQYDAILVSIADWRPLDYSDVRFWFVLDKPDLAPQQVLDRSGDVTEQMCLVVSEDRSPSRTGLLEPHFPQTLKVPSSADHVIDFSVLLQLWVDMGLTHLGIDAAAAGRGVFEPARDQT